MKKIRLFLPFLFLLILFQVVYAADLEVHFINVGQGDSIFVKTPDDKTILIDASKHYTTQDKYNPFSYLKSLSVDHLDAIFITHPHDDHYKGFKYLCAKKGKKEFPVKAVYYSVEVGEEYGKFEDCLEEIINESDGFGQMSSRGPPIEFGEVVFTILYPDEPIANPNSNKNLDSIVMRMTYKNVSFMFTGDTEKKIEKTLTGDLKSTVLKVAHHGAETATDITFLKAVDPEYAVISCNDKDYRNRYGHPRKATLDNLKAKKVKLYRTDLNGTIVMTSNGESIVVTPEKEVSQDSTKLWKPGKIPSN